VGQADLVEQPDGRVDDPVEVVSLRPHASDYTERRSMNGVQEGVAMGSNDGWTGRDLARVAVFAAVIVVLGMVGPIPGPGAVPITAQTLGVMLTGAILGARRGAASVLIVFLLVAIGLPVLAGGRGGLGVFLGPTAGFLIGWLPAAVVIGLIAHSGLLTWWRTGIACLVGG